MIGYRGRRAVRRAVAPLSLALWAAIGSSAHAGVVIGGTRVIFPGASRDVAVRIENKGEAPALVQVWVDDGDERSTPETAHAPFAITPPVFRIDPGRGHALRIVHVGDTAPADRETLYWLNVLEIPPKPDAGAGANLLQFAFRHRVKLMHRPARLPVGPSEAPSSLRWSLGKDGAKNALAVSNPSPYVVSFNDVSITAGGAATSLGGGMVLPGSTTTFPLKGAPLADEAGEVRFATINDYGAIVPHTSRLPSPARVIDD